MTIKLEIKLLPNEDGTRAMNVAHMELNNRGTWERGDSVELSDKAVVVALGLYDRVVIEGHQEYEVVYDAEQNVSRIQKKPEPPAPEPPPVEGRSAPKSAAKPALLQAKDEKPERKSP